MHHRKEENQNKITHWRLQENSEVLGIFYNIKKKNQDSCQICPNPDGSHCFSLRPFYHTGQLTVSIKNN